MYETSNYLAHYQIKGAKHGHRRWQNEDGSLTPEGRIHYGVGPPRGESNTSKKTDIHIGKNIKSSFNAEIKNKKENYDLNDVKNSLKKVREQAKTIQNNMKNRSLEKAREKAEKKEQAAKEAEGKRIAEEKIKKEEELAKARAEVDALKEYYTSHPLKIYEARKVLSKEDIKDVEDQILFERQLKDFRRDEIMRHVRTAGDIAQALDNTYKGAKKIADFYNLGADTYNSLIARRDPDDDKKPIPRIKFGQDDPSKKKRNEKNKDQDSDQSKKK